MARRRRSSMPRAYGMISRSRFRKLQMKKRDRQLREPRYPRTGTYVRAGRQYK